MLRKGGGEVQQGESARNRAWRGNLVRGLRGARGKGIAGITEEVRSFGNFGMQDGIAGRGGSPEIKRMTEQGFKAELGRDEWSGKGDGEARTGCWREIGRRGEGRTGEIRRVAGCGTDHDSVSGSRVEGIEVEMIARGKIEGKSERKYVGESGSEVGAGLASREEEEEGRDNDDPGGVDSDRKFGREDGNWKDRKFLSWRERRWGCSARAETEIP